MEPSTRRSSHRTQWAAQFAVGSELCKRGYEVAFTMGNHPSVDIMVTSPAQTAFFIDVKGLYQRNFWAIRAKPERKDLFYVLAFVPDEGPNRFFVLTQAQVNDEIAREIGRARQRAIAKNNTSAKPDSFPGIGWAFAEPFEGFSGFKGGWEVLPA